MRRVVVLAEAANDLEAVRDFYDEREETLGDYCVDCLVSDIESLAIFHGVHRREYGFYRMLAKRFPFGIYYWDTTEDTQAIAVLDLRRDPSWIHDELIKRL